MLEESIMIVASDRPPVAQPALPLADLPDEKLVELLRNSSTQVFQVLSYKTGNLWEELEKRLKNKSP